jgi:multidrug efflux system membrane fusion protein
MSLRSRTLLVLAVLATLALATLALAVEGPRLAGLTDTGEGPAAASAAETPAAATPAVPVVVETLEPQRLRVWSSFSGRLQAVEAVEIRPEVGGRITEVLFEDGQEVAVGDILFVIDPAPYEAAVARAEAALASAEADLAFAKVDFQRAATLVKKRAVAERYYDERQNAERVAQAALQTAEAELRQARIDLDHAYVRSPISGRAGRVELTVGNLVQPGPTAPLLTTVVANQSIYADFEVDEQTYLNSIRGQASGRDQERRIPVELEIAGAALPDSAGEGPEGSAYRGRIYSFDNRIDVASGTIRARARFDNADGRLLPGMFVSVRLADAVERSLLAVPERAVGSDQSKTFVYVVEESDKVAYREVTLGRQVQGARRIVLSGLAPGERVIVDGLQHVRPGTLVAARELDAEGPAVAQQAAQQAAAAR